MKRQDPDYQGEEKEFSKRPKTEADTKISVVPSATADEQQLLPPSYNREIKRNAVPSNAISIDQIPQSNLDKSNHLLPNGGAPAAGNGSIGAAADLAQQGNIAASLFMNPAARELLFQNQTLRQLSQPGLPGGFAPVAPPSNLLLDRLLAASQLGPSSGIDPRMMQALGMPPSQQLFYQAANLQQPMAPNMAQFPMGAFLPGSFIPQEMFARVPPAALGSEFDTRAGHSASLATASPHRVIPVSVASDRVTLSDYQCLIREQIFLFEANQEDVASNAQGRNKPIRLRQVGIICRHCTHLTPGRRARGAVYFPAKLKGIYQAAQNMTVNHFHDTCTNIPEVLRARLMLLKEKKTIVHGGGKQYWADTAREVGVGEGEEILEFISPGATTQGPIHQNHGVALLASTNATAI
jgi:hypothetical protein